MKKNLTALILLVILLVSSNTAQHVLGKERGQTVLCKVEGLSCPFCAHKAEAQLQKIEGIQEIKVDLEKSEITLIYLSHKKINKLQIVQAIADAGFKAIENLVLPNYQMTD